MYRFNSQSIRPNLKMPALIVAVIGLMALQQPPSAQATSYTSSGSSQKACKSAGYMWSSSLRKCANKNCSANGQNYSPGATRISTPVLGVKRVYLWCDGFTGK